MKYIFIAVLCLLASIGYSQVYRLRAFKVHVALFDENREISNPDVWAESDALVVINVDKYKLQVYGSKDVDIDLIKKDSTVEQDDKITFYYRGIDDIGQKCKVVVIIFKKGGEKHVATTILDYVDMKTVIVYKLRKDDE